MAVLSSGMVIDSGPFPSIGQVGPEMRMWSCLHLKGFQSEGVFLSGCVGV